MSKDQTLIDRFIAGDLSEEELESFDNRINADGSFANLVAVSIAIDKDIKDKRSKLLDESLKEYDDNKKRRNNRRIASFIIVAIITIIVLLKYMNREPTQLLTPPSLINKSDDSLIEDQFKKPLPELDNQDSIRRIDSKPTLKKPVDLNRDSIRSSNSIAQYFKNNPIKKASILTVMGKDTVNWRISYSRDSFLMVINALKDIAIPLSADQSLALAYSYYTEEEFTLAASTLENYINANTDVKKEGQIKWFLVGLYNKTGQTDQAIDLLKNMANSSVRMANKPKAKLLLNQLSTSPNQ